MPRTKVRSFLLVKCDSLPIQIPNPKSQIPNPKSQASADIATDRLATQEDLGPELRPLRVLVEGNDGIDHLERKLVEGRVDGAAGRHAVARLEDRLPLA